MTVEQLRDLTKVAKSYPNYHLRDISEEEFQNRANLSYSRMTPDHKKMFQKACIAYGLIDTKDETTTQETLKEAIRWRFMCQTNLFFLCNVLEKYKDVSQHEYVWLDGEKHNTHEEICNEFFVSKDPTKKSFKEFAFGYIDKKERLLLVPRGGFKSSMDMADTVQWIICFPEVTILILTGVLDLAKDFVKEIKSFFELEEGAMPETTTTPSIFGKGKTPLRPKTLGDDTSFMFQVLFPEHCIPIDEGKQYEFQTPAVSITQKECTVFAASIDQNLSGWHVGVMKLDDVVTNENSRTIERIKAVNKQVSINNAMLHPYGFFDKIGTWYDQSDTYGQDMAFIERCEKDGEPIKMKVYLRPAWWPNEAARKAGKVEAEMTEHDWTLWFPVEGQLTYSFLRGKKMADPDGFAIKYLNDPTQVHRVKFSRELLVRRTIHSNQLPQQGMIVTTVDTAYSTKNWADYTVILTALIYGGRFYIIDMVRGRFNEHELPGQIANTAFKWKPKRICIEDSVGVKWLGKEVYREMDKLRVRVPLEFVPLGQGSTRNAKDMKAKPVVRYLGDERLFFANQCVGLEELYTELTNFGTASATHDDIVSALSILLDQFASYADMEGRQTQALPSFVSDQKTKAMYDQIYGPSVFSKVAGAQSFEAMMENPSLGAHGAVQQQQEIAAADSDPLAAAGLY